MDDVSFSPDAHLMRLLQDGHPLESYVENFVELYDRVSWRNSLLNMFLNGLDDDLLVSCFSQKRIDSLSHALEILCSSVCVGEADDEVSPLLCTFTFWNNNVIFTKKAYYRILFYMLLVILFII